MKQNKINISKDIKKLRKRHINQKAGYIVTEMEKHYHKHNYDEKLLFKRIKKLETNVFLPNSIFASLIGAFLGMFITYVVDTQANVSDFFATTIRKIEEPYIEVIVSFIVIFVFIIVMLFMIAIVMFTFFFIVKMFVFATTDFARGDYLNQKEIEIIKAEIENNSNRNSNDNYKVR